MVQFCVLGPVEIRDERTASTIVPPGAKQRALLGALVAMAGQAVPAPRLIEEVWADRPPANASNALQAHVLRLRRLLPAPAPGGPRHEWIVTGPLGYELRPGTGTVDAQLFRRLVSEGRGRAVDDPERAGELLRSALALWRGPAFHGGVRGEICAVQAAQLDEARLLATEALYDAGLRAGRHREIVGELDELTVAHPTRERFHEQLMVALDRCGRRADALGVYDRARRRMRQELGVEPGPALRRRAHALARHDMVTPTAEVPHGAAATTVPGRGGEIARLRQRIELLSIEQRELKRRFDALVAQEAARA
ncbi:AfsR/SARP family transcriptional regulator [Streptomyces sp. NPDC050264]|uniref:AfsR/SARP family transcriptional regulator n=1 Tax=Streptomyces sp. NPDC050264 TaxID=3155038 RepID=UPI003446002E